MSATTLAAEIVALYPDGAFDDMAPAPLREAVKVLSLLPALLNAGNRSADYLARWDVPDHGRARDWLAARDAVLAALGSEQ